MARAGLPFFTRCGWCFTLKRALGNPFGVRPFKGFFTADPFHLPFGALVIETAISINRLMKTLNLTRFALLAAAALFSRAAFAAKPPPPPPSSGTVMLDYLYPGGAFAENFGLTVTPSGEVFASGTADVDNNNQWNGIVLGNGAARWGPLDNFGSAGYYTYGGVISSDAAGNLYTASVVFGGLVGESDRWIVRRSADGGATWTTEDNFNQGFDFSGNTYPTGIAVDLSGNVYVAGQSYVPGNPAGTVRSVWTIRKGMAGVSFSTVDTVLDCTVNGLLVHPIAGIFAVGQLGASWGVRRSTDGGATWSTIESFQLQSGLSSVAQAVGADNAGNIYVAGSGNVTTKGKTSRHWLIRKSSDGGNSWSTFDDFLSSGSNAEARRVALTSNGDLYVAGYMDGQNILRKRAAGTATWTTVDVYPFEARGIAANASGNLFLGGMNASTGHWMIKKY